MLPKWFTVVGQIWGSITYGYNDTVTVALIKMSGKILAPHMGDLYLNYTGNMH